MKGDSIVDAEYAFSRIKGNYRPASLFRFVGQNRQEPAPGLVVDISGQAASHQAFEVQGFHVMEMFCGSCLSNLRLKDVVAL